jgi:hypothetical protein
MKRLLCYLACCLGLFAVAASAQMPSIPSTPSTPSAPSTPSVPSTPSTPSMPSMTSMHKPKAPPLSPDAKAEGTIGDKAITITYSSPRVRGRAGKIFTKDGLIGKDPHYPVWRAGANAATTIVLGGDVKIGTLAVPKGTYTLFADISDPDNWTLIVSKDTKEWGLAYDATKDLGKTPMTMSVPSDTVEELVYTISDNGDGTGTITLSWENHTAVVAVDAK